ncbi:MAG TPA: PDZ domain-containing protein [Gemmatimonadales bacterium]|nr:PDZ domain-containing protein [Gemmatimonadales bacterium]
MHASIPIRSNPRYIALLVGVALLILLVGAFLRPRARQAVPVVPSNELATLPDRTQRRALRDLADYIAQRASDVGSSVIHLADLGTSGLVLAGDSVLTAVAESAERDAPVRVRFLIHSLATDSARPAVASVEVDTSPQWRLVVARSPEGQSLTLTGMTGGAIETQCGDFILREMIFDAVIPPAFAGGGIFDLDGNAIGLVVPCGNRVALVSIGEVSRLMVLQQSPEHRLWTGYGFRAQPADSTRTPLPYSGEGLLVTEVRIGSLAYQAGIRAGDLIVRINSEPASRVEDLAPLFDEPGARPLLLQRTARGLAVNVRSSPVQSLPQTPPSSSSTGGLALTTVEPGSKAARSGLKPGDRIVQVGRSRAPTANLLRRALSDTTPVFLVYERDGLQRAVVLR